MMANAVREVLLGVRTVAQMVEAFATRSYDYSPPGG
jgi:hypothetical protein